MPAYTWTTGETITAAKLQALEDEAWRVANLLASNTTTAESQSGSTTFVNGAASVTFTAKSSSVYVQISSGGCSFGVGALYTFGVNVNGTDYTLSAHETGSGGGWISLCGGQLITGLTPGTTYTATLRFRTSSASYTAYVNRNSYSRQTITIWDISK